MSRILVRAKLPMWYTQGFNPHAKVIFGLPLSVGTESECEFIDLRVDRDITGKEVKERLNRELTDEMQVIEAYYPETKFTDLAWLSYTVKIKTENASRELAGACDSLLNSEKIEILKNTKSGEKMVDIRPLIRNASAVLDGDFIRISACLSADPAMFLNPEYLIKALRDKLGVLSSPDLTKEEYSIMRERAYFADMTEFR
jgi:radical SAM-linked protein